MSHEKNHMIYLVQNNNMKSFMRKEYNSWRTYYVLSFYNKPYLILKHSYKLDAIIL